MGISCTLSLITYFNILSNKLYDKKCDKKCLKITFIIINAAEMKENVYWLTYIVLVFVHCCVFSSTRFKSHDWCRVW